MYTKYLEAWDDINRQILKLREHNLKITPELINEIHSLSKEFIIDPVFEISKCFESLILLKYKLIEAFKNKWKYNTNIQYEYLEYKIQDYYQLYDICLEHLFSLKEINKNNNVIFNQIYNKLFLDLLMQRDRLVTILEIIDIPKIYTTNEDMSNIDYCNNITIIDLDGDRVNLSFDKIQRIIHKNMNHVIIYVQ